MKLRKLSLLAQTDRVKPAVDHYVLALFFHEIISDVRGETCFSLQEKKGLLSESSLSHQSCYWGFCFPNQTSNNPICPLQQPLYFCVV